MAFFDTGIDTRTNQKVTILDTKKDACKDNKAIVLTHVPMMFGCVPIHAQYIPGGRVYDEFLCEYPDGSLTWVDGKFIKVSN